MVVTKLTIQEYYDLATTQFWTMLEMTEEASPESWLPEYHQVLLELYTLVGGIMH